MTSYNGPTITAEDGLRTCTACGGSTGYDEGNRILVVYAVDGGALFRWHCHHEPPQLNKPASPIVAILGSSDCAMRFFSTFAEPDKEEVIQ